MAKFKIAIIVPDGDSCRHEKSGDWCDFVRNDQCNEYTDCCLFGQRLNEDLSIKCPKYFEQTKRGGKDGIR